MSRTPSILAIDQGTTGTTCLVFSADGQVLGRRRLRPGLRRQAGDRAGVIGPGGAVRLRPLRRACLGAWPIGRGAQVSAQGVEGPGEPRGT